MQRSRLCDIINENSQEETTMLGDMKPFRMAGNLYFVGTFKASSHLIDTGDGLILIDTGYEETAEVVIESVTELGFDVRDIRYILHSHGHCDHTDGTPRMVEVSGAETFLAKADLKYLKGWTPDHDLRDGDVITLGNTQILCLSTPGHTEGTTSFFFNVEDGGKVYRAGMFGGAGTNQLKKDFLDQQGCSWLNRGLFFSSIDRLKKEHVDIFVGNHAWNNRTRENYELMLTADHNPFIDDSKWLPFLEKCERDLWTVMLQDSRTHFVNYAHRGASEYTPENTMLAFYTGLYMGANGIETDVQRTKDGVLVLFHDDTILRLTGAEGSVCDYTLDELRAFSFEKNGLKDQVVVFEDFLRQFGWRDLRFAIEIKQRGIETEIADMLRKYDMGGKCVVTSFKFDCIEKIRQYAPELKVGWLKKEFSEAEEQQLLAIGGEEICPFAPELTPEMTQRWHRMGLNVRAWGVRDEEVMRSVCACMADGMTVNFPDRLSAYLQHRE